MNGSVVFTRWRQCAPTWYTVPWTHPSPHPKQHLDRSSLFCRAHDRDRPTDRLTDHSTRPVAIGGIYVVRRCGLITFVTTVRIIMITSLSCHRRTAPRRPASRSLCC